MKAISVESATYLEGFKVKVIFNDKKKKVVNFGPFLNKHSHPQFNKYKKQEHFQKFKVENGNLVWGKDWDMIFPVDDLYHGKIVK